MHQSYRKISVVIEAGASVNGLVATSVFDTLETVIRQNWLPESLEVLVCQHGWSDEKIQLLKNRYPAVRILASPLNGYYRLKNLGFEHSTGNIIALVDSDCRYSPDWIASIVETIEKGAEVSVGFTVLTGKSLFRRLCGFYDLHSMLLRIDKSMRRFNSNNVAFRADIVRAQRYDGRFERTGGCVQLAERLRRSGARIEFNPSQFTVHEYYGFHKHTWKQAICNGYDIFHTREVDPGMPLGRITKMKVLAPPVLCAIFIASDVWNMVQNRSILNIRWYEFPAFLAFSILVRSIEIVGMYWTLLHPSSIAKFVMKNFA